MSTATTSPTPLPAKPVARPAETAAPPAAESAARNWSEYRLRAARRLVAANAQMAYTGPVPEPLLAIPVIEVELKSDGGIASLKVLREPHEAKDTVQLALEALRRAAPFGDVSRLPKPWRYTEVFLFNDERRFKPRALDE